MHDCFMACTFALGALYCGSAVLSEMSVRGTALETDSFLFEEGLSFIEQFVPECPAFIEWVGLIVQRAVLIKVLAGGCNISFIYRDGFGRAKVSQVGSF